MTLLCLRSEQKMFNFLDFKSMFEKAGLELVNCYGNYDLAAYERLDSPRLIMVLKKKAESWK